jgi:hypothetical protein
LRLIKTKHTKSRRQFCGRLTLLSLLAGCNPLGQSSQLSEAQRRLRGINLALVVDAVPGAKLLGVEFYADGSNREFYSSSTTWKGNREIMALPLNVIPEKIRIMWRDSNELVGRSDEPSKSTYAGNILGDYTILVASRIPDDVIKEIRKKGGGLRLKFRLKPDGVLFGWDIERILNGFPEHGMPGGDFLETEY